MIYIVNHTAHEFSFVPENEYRDFYFSMTKGAGRNHRWLATDTIQAKTVDAKLYEKIKKLKFRLPSLLDYNQMY